MVVLGQLLILLLVLPILGQNLNVNVNADHVHTKKFVLFDHRLVTELRGIVAHVSDGGDTLLIIPDPNYRNLAVEGNTITPPGQDCVRQLTTVFFSCRPGLNIQRWTNHQNDVEQCNLPADKYPEPHPLIKLEKYGYDHIASTPFGGKPKLAGFDREVRICDHVRILGYYVIDHGHSMYSNYCILGGEREEGANTYLTCIPHAELHPFLVSTDPGNENTIEPVTELQPGSINTQTLSVFLPYYNRYYSYDDYHNFWGVGGQIVDDSKIVSSTTEWFIEAPPPPADNCRGACELIVTEEIIKKRGQVQVEINKEANGARVRVSAAADSSADYVPSQSGYVTNGVENPTIYQAKFRAFWIPKQPALQIEPGTIPAGIPTDMTVRAQDKITGDAVFGRIMINDTEVGTTNTPFQYTFSSKNYGTAKVIAQGYVETPIYFSISSPLEVRAEPSTIQIGTETLVTIHAVSPVTREPVAGNVVILSRGLLPEEEISDTNTPFRHTFRPVPNETRCPGGYYYSYPEVSVEAPGYDTAKVRIDFTGSLPGGDPGDPTLCLPADGDDIEDGDDCPNPRRCPIDEGIRDGPEPFDLP